MPLQLPTDLETLVQRRLATGIYVDAEDVLRRALEDQDAEDWTSIDRDALDRRIDIAREQMAAGASYGPAEAKEKLAAMRAAHLSRLGR